MKVSNPESLGFSADRLEEAGRRLEQLVSSGQVVGLSAAVLRRGEPAFVGAYGLLDLRSGRRMQADSIFQIQSISKPIAGLAVLMLMEHGKIGLEDPIADYIPVLSSLQVLSLDETGEPKLSPCRRPVTVRDLFLHESGMSYTSQAPRRLAAFRSETEVVDPANTLGQRVEALAELPLVHQPGEAWRYGFSYDVLAYLVEVISGQRFGEFLRQRLFEPLQMDDTGYFVPLNRLPRLASPYQPAPSGPLTAVRWLPPYEISDPSRPALGSTGLLSTVPDFLRLCQMLLYRGRLGETRILQPETIDLLTTNHLGPDVLKTFSVSGFADHRLTDGYGFGFGVRVMLDPEAAGVPTSVGEYGWVGTYNTHFWVDPAQDLIGLIWTQLLAPLHSLHLDRIFKRLVYRALLE